MYVLYKSKNILTFVTIGYIVGFIVGMYIEYCLWAQVAVLDIYIAYIGLFEIGKCRFYTSIVLELPVQRRLCPNFVKNVGPPDIHEYSAG